MNFDYSVSVLGCVQLNVYSKFQLSVSLDVNPHIAIANEPKIMFKPGLPHTYRGSVLHFLVSGHIL